MTDPMGNPRTDELLAHAGWVRSLARRLAEDHAAADDLVQETWLRALRSPPAEDRNAAGWLARVTRNAKYRQWLNESRRVDRERAAMVDEPRSSPSTDELVAEAERQQQVGRSVLDLEEPYRSIILRHYWRGESAAEIGTATGVSAATVRSQLARARARLQEVLDRGHGGDRDASLRSLLIAAGPVLRSGTRAGLAPAVPASIPSITSWLHGAIVMKTSTTVLALFALLLILVGGWAALGSDIRTSPAGDDANGSSARLSETSRPSGETAEDRSPPSTGARESVEVQEETSLAGRSESTEHERMTTIIARAVDGAGKPVRSATLRKSSRDTGARSDDDGSLALHLPDDQIDKWQDEIRSMIFVLDAPGYATQFLRATPVVGDAIDLGERVLGSEARLSGRLVDDLGRGVDGLEVLAAPIGPDRPEVLRRSRGPELGDGVIETTSASDGQFLLTGVTAGTLRVWARTETDGWVCSPPIVAAPGDEIDQIDVLVTAPDPLDVIELRLLGKGDAPLESANLAFAPDGRGYVQHKSVRPDEEGRVRFIAEARVPHDFRIEGGEWELQPRVVRGLVPGEPRVTVRLEPARTIQVVVSDAKSNAPIDDAWVYTRGEDELLTYDPRARKPQHRPVATSPYTIRVPSWSFTVHAKHDSFTPSEHGPHRPSQAPDEIVIELDRMASLQGTVLEGGRAVQGAKVELRPAPGPNTVYESYGFELRMDAFAEASTTSDVDGRFTLATGRKADYFLVVTKTGLATAEAGPITLGPTIAHEPVTIEMTKGGSIRGRLLVPDGEANHGRLIALSRLDGSPRVVRTNERGEFEASGLAPGGWLVETRDQEVRRSVSVSMRDEHGPPPIWHCQVLDGQTTTFDLDLRSRSLTKISGRLTGAGQEFGAWTARLQALRHETGAAEIPAILVGGDGRFEFEVEPGGWSLELAGTATVADEDGEPRRADWKIWSRLDVAGDVLPLEFTIEPARLDVTTRTESGPMRINKREESPIPGVEFRSTVVNFDAKKNQTVIIPAPLGSSELERPTTGDFAPGAMWETVREIEVDPGQVSVVVDR